MQSPYINKPTSEWKSITTELVSQIPLNTDELVKIVLQSWECIFQSEICELKIGTDIFPSPQMMGNFLETAIAANLSKKHPDIWKHGKEKDEKDVVCLTNQDYSIEIKTSSSPKNIFGNRSYAQPQSDFATKSKDSFYLAVNFEQPKTHKTEISLIQFGYLDHSDWIAQVSATGQQARLSSDTYQRKFIVLYEKPKKTKKLK
jgi:hypothetical protein